MLCLLVVSSLECGDSGGSSDPIITQIMDETGDGAGNILFGNIAVAVDASSNVYVSGMVSRNVFRVSPSGAITEIIDGTGDGTGNELYYPVSKPLAPSAESAAPCVPARTAQRSGE